MKFIKYTDRAKIEKYVNEIEVITFVTKGEFLWNTLTGKDLKLINGKTKLT